MMAVLLVDGVILQVRPVDEAFWKSPGLGYSCWVLYSSVLVRGMLLVNVRLFLDQKIHLVFASVWPLVA